MWRIIKWTILSFLLVAIGGFIHYYLPKRDVVRILANEIIRRDYTTTNAQGQEVTRTRDVRQIYAETSDGETMEFDNTDAPVYLKFDSANITAEAERMVSNENTPMWAVVTYYGWRIPIMSWFPNVIDIRAAEGPDENLFPWINIVVIGTLLSVFLVLRRIVLIQIGRFTDPVIEDREREEERESGFFSRQARRVGRLFGRS